MNTPPAKYTDPYGSAPDPVVVLEMNMMKQFWLFSLWRNVLSLWVYL